MNVLMVDQWLPAQPYALDLSRELSKHVNLTLVTPRYFHPTSEKFRCMNVLESKVKEKKSGIFCYLGGLLRLGGAVLFGKYDVIHIQAFKQQRIEMPLIRTACSLSRKKLVYTAHNIMPHEKIREKDRNQLKKWYRHCDAIIVHNEHSKQVLMNVMPECANRTHVIPHGTFSDFEGKGKDEKHEKTVFLQFGMIREYKGIPDLLKAASMIPMESRKQISIIIAGNQRKDLDATDYQAILDEYGLQDFVRLDIRRIPDEEVPDLFNGSDCCLFPYTEIYGSGALLMAYGLDKPVIASGIPTFIEETEHGATGLLYDPEDAEGLMKAILRFTSLTEKERDEMKQRIQVLCKTKYNWETSSRKLASVYQLL